MLQKLLIILVFNVEEGEFVGIMGPSGSETILPRNCISTVDNVTTGNIKINGKEITNSLKV